MDAGKVAAAAAPVLVPGSDDIYWVNQLHSALSGKGFFPGDEEMEAWLFGDQTASALLTFQVPSSARRFLMSIIHCPHAQIHCLRTSVGTPKRQDVRSHMLPLCMLCTYWESALTLA